MKSTSRRRVVAAIAFLGCTLAPAAFAQDVKGKLVLYTSQPERDAAQTVYDEICIYNPDRSYTDRFAALLRPYYLYL